MRVQPFDCFVGELYFPLKGHRFLRKQKVLREHTASEHDFMNLPAVECILEVTPPTRECQCHRYFLFYSCQVRSSEGVEQKQDIRRYVWALPGIC